MEIFNRLKMKKNFMAHTQETNECKRQISGEKLWKSGFQTFPKPEEINNKQTVNMKHM